jgi:hypothetical protein
LGGGSPPISTAATSAASRASPRHSNTASSVSTKVRAHSGAPSGRSGRGCGGHTYGTDSIGGRVRFQKTGEAGSALLSTWCLDLPFPGASFGLRMVRKSKLLLSLSLLLAALSVGLCRVGLAQGDADLEAPGLAPFPATMAHGATLFQNVRIFDGKSDALSAPYDVLVRTTSSSAYLRARSPSTRRLTSASLLQTGGC